jgi:hypothetical protein
MKELYIYNKLPHLLLLLLKIIVVIIGRSTNNSIRGDI